jgi:hypothetical protein
MVHMKCQALENFQPFFSFFNVFDKKRGHNMLALMLNLRFKKCNWWSITYGVKLHLHWLLNMMFVCC